MPVRVHSFSCRLNLFVNTYQVKSICAQMSGSVSSGVVVVVVVVVALSAWSHLRRWVCLAHRLSVLSS